MRGGGFNWRRMPELGALMALFLVFLYAPLVILIIYAFNGSDLALVWGGFSMRWFAKALANEDLRRAAYNSLVIGVSATIISTAFAVPAALAFERGRRFWGRAAGDGLIALPLVEPEVVTAVTTLAFFSGINLQLGLGNLIIAHAVFCIPFAVLPIRARLREMPSDIEDAARDLYGNDWQVFRLVTLPLLMPAIVSGAMLAFVVSLDDFLISMMVAQAGSTTLPVYLYGMLRLGVTPEANAAATLLLAVSVAAVSLSYLFTSRRRKAY